MAETEKKSEMINFNEISNTYFKSYAPVFEPSINRIGNKSGTILIKKKNLSKKEMNTVTDKMKTDGWVEFEHSTNYALYCLNKYQLIGILYPNNLIERNKNGEEIIYEDINSWNIGLYYNQNGINSCIK
ncbi:hypothetical protein [Acinetobacter sp. ANC 3832]|uniref:hypothetical protein n=1 Tax=Acinetobacter sp. ANC 3832 TaxID=1977874 RepID=UPI001D17334D|nr:hypothetical protein [Acinetobacter sp. ANC 3832]